MLTTQRNTAAVTQRRTGASPQLPARTVIQPRGNVAANANMGDALKGGVSVALAAAMLLTSTPQPAQANRDALEQTIRASDEVPKTISKNADRATVDVRQSTVGAIKRAADAAKNVLNVNDSIPSYTNKLRNRAAGDDRSSQLRQEARDSKSAVLGNDGFKDLRRATDTGNPLGGLKSAADDASSSLKDSTREATGAVKRAAEDAKRNLGVSMNFPNSVLGDLAADTTLGRDPVSGLKEAADRGKNILSGGGSATSGLKSATEDATSGLKSAADDAKRFVSGSGKNVGSGIRETDAKTRTSLFGGAGDDRSEEMRAKAVESKSVVLGKDQGPIDLRKNTPEGNPIGGIKSAADDASSALGAKGAAGSIKDAARDAKRTLGVSMAPTSNNVLGDLAADTTLGRDPVSGLKEAADRGKNILSGGGSATSGLKSATEDATSGLKSAADDAKRFVSGSGKDVGSGIRETDAKTRTSLFGGAGDDRSEEMRAKAVESKSVVLGKDQGPINLRKNTPEGNPIGGIKSAADDASSALGAKGAAGSIKDAARDAKRTLGVSMAPTSNNVLGDLAADTTLGRDPISGLKEAADRGKNIISGGSENTKSGLKSATEDAKRFISGSNKDIGSSIGETDAKTRTNLFGGANDDRSEEMRAKAVESKSVVLGKDQGPIDLRRNTPEGNPIGGIKSAADDASSALGVKGAAGSIKDAARDAKRNLGISMAPTSNVLGDLAADTTLGRDPVSGLKEAADRGKNILSGGGSATSGLKSATEDATSGLKSAADDAKRFVSGSGKDVGSGIRETDAKTRTSLFGGAGDDRSEEMRAKAVESKSVVLGKDQGPINLRKNTPEGNSIGGIKSAADDASSALGAKGAAGSIKDAARDAKRTLGVSMAPTSYPLFDLAETTVSEGIKEAAERGKNILSGNLAPTGDAADKSSVLGASGKAPRLESVNPGGEAGTRLVVNPPAGDFGKESDSSRDSLRDPTKNDQRLDSVKNASRQIRDTIVDQSSTNALGASAAKGAVQDVKDTFSEAAGGLYGQAEKAKANLQQAASDKGKLNVNAVNVKDGVDVKAGGAGTTNMGDNDKPGQTNRPFGGWSSLFGSGKY